MIRFEVLSDCFHAFCLDDAYLTGKARRVASDVDSPVHMVPRNKSTRILYINQNKQIFPKIIGYHQNEVGIFPQN